MASVPREDNVLRAIPKTACNFRPFETKYQCRPFERPLAVTTVC